MKSEIHTFRVWHETDQAIKLSYVPEDSTRVGFPIKWVPKSVLTIHSRDGNIIKATLPDFKMRGFLP